MFTKTTCLGKIWILSYGPKTSRPIRMQDSLNCSVLQTIWGMKLNFCTWLDVHRSNKLTKPFQVYVVRHAWEYSKLCKMWVRFISQEWLELWSSFFDCRYGSIEVTNYFNHFKWIWLGIPKVIENNEPVLSQKRI